MEIKNILEKPYTERQHDDFIVANRGFEIRETTEQLQSWGYTEEEIAQQEFERVMRLSCTKRDFALMLQEYGITYTQLKTTYY